MSANPLILLGSSRGDGNTAKALQAGFGAGAWVDLESCAIAPYDYAHDYPDGDGFLTVVAKMIAASDVVLATPVYWYAMSAQMKTFLDRWSDLVMVRKDMGRAMAGRRLWVLATSADPEFPPGFEVPFELTARYMGMSYGGGLLLSCSSGGDMPDDSAAALSIFAARVKASAKGARA